MVESNNPRKIEIVKKTGGSLNSGVSVVIGGVTIKASGKPMEVQLRDRWGKVYLVIDCSGSMAGYKIEQASQGILDFAKDAIRKEYLVGLIKFGSSVEHICEPTRSISTVEKHLTKLLVSGSTNMADAIKMGYERLAKYEQSKAIIIATDGLPDSIEDTLKAAKEAKDSGIHLITIGTDDADYEFLKKLASRNDLGTKVSVTMFAKAISSAYMLLPSPKT